MLYMLICSVLMLTLVKIMWQSMIAAASGERQLIKMNLKINRRKRINGNFLEAAGYGGSGCIYRDCFALAYS
ncbi:hypothetical protein E2P38_20425 [Escherichia coli]|uniref:Uncharacterized protein n=4 Tax=Salmonella enterica TaxID=28901 RepID=A0A639KX40_SALTM|nr:hypothetical protein [Salmonella enterica]EBE0861716.1 hypothetical protein [Salmonella enterica subsp. enterica serovar Reading]ECD4797032.1 hypothetical protein [Salmonella enterica subsp. enterica serovar Cotham]ECH7810058.1 hypothetical protein [Salmonella enterica subsp. enterica serovar Enteritidis]ECX9832088.1 hypothetical protein [Salmonella enterica subsp. enterica serovar Berta]EDI4572169.1 hypothetical protein [Salmonella enterica subsp. enterica serovar Agona]EDJ0993979.1 hypot